MGEFIRSLNWVDYLILFGSIRGAYTGYRDGLFKEALRLFLYIVTLCIIIIFSDAFADVLEEATMLGDQGSHLLAMIGMAIAVYLILKLISAIILRWASLDNNFFLKLLGLIVGVGRWTLILSFVLWGIEAYDFISLGSDVSDHSVWGASVVSLSPNLSQFLTETLPQSAAY